MHKTFSILEHLHGQRLDKALSLLVQDVSREKIKKLIMAGAVTHGGKVINDPSFHVEEGQAFEVDYDVQSDHISSLKGEDIPLDILFEDDAVMVINKPVGMVVHPGAGNHSGTLVHALLYHCGKNLSTMGDKDRPGIVHRLDKDTSGLMIVAKTDRAHAGMVAQFEDRSLSRSYLAFVEGLLNPLSGMVDKSIARSDSNRKKMAVFDIKGKPAITHYHTLKPFVVGQAVLASLVECTLETGRTHQIRVHLASLGHGVIGDPTYGRHRKKAVLERLMSEHPCQYWKNNRQALHAYKLRFNHPITGEPLCFECPLPDDLKELQQILEAG
jgi:23S rRNA pseudouridine1911/1915/1917 synthase